MNQSVRWILSKHSSIPIREVIRFNSIIIAHEPLSDISEIVRYSENKREHPRRGSDCHRDTNRKTTHYDILGISGDKDIRIWWEIWFSYRGDIVSNVRPLEKNDKIIRSCIQSYLKNRRNVNSSCTCCTQCIPQQGCLMKPPLQMLPVEWL